jgi:undecaprenyl-diphosphatase
MHIFQSIILGVVEGVTEFLPISSTGHMILASHVLNVPEDAFTKSFEIFIQLGAILAVVALYWKKLLMNKKIFLRVCVAFLPTAIIGLTVYKFVKTYLLGNMMVVLWSLLLGGIFLIAFEYYRKGKTSNISELENISYKQAFIIGLFQTIAIIPGVSRSAATIVGGLALGISRDAIVEFSFMLAVPTMAAATLLDLIKSGHSFNGGQVQLLIIGFITAFVSAFFAIKFLLNYVKKNTFTNFGIYRIIISILFLAVIYIS